MKWKNEGGRTGGSKAEMRERDQERRKHESRKEDNLVATR
jgi:hypothetical protein